MKKNNLMVPRYTIKIRFITRHLACHFCMTIKVIYIQMIFCHENLSISFDIDALNANLRAISEIMLNVCKF